MPLVDVIANSRRRGESDPNFASLVFGSHFDGSNGSTTLTDIKGHTWTANGDAQISTAQYKFGGASGMFDGTGDYWSASDSADWDLGAGDFTIQTFLRPNGTGDKAIWSQWGASSNKAVLFSINSTSMTFFWTTNGTTNQSVSVSATTSNGTWYHVAVCRSGTNLRFFLDGVQQGATQTLSGTIYNSTADATIGINVTTLRPMNGWLDDMQVYKAALYTGNFTPRTTAFPDS